jgi:hypothetical protein
VLQRCNHALPSSVKWAFYDTWLQKNKSKYREISRCTALVHFCGERIFSCAMTVPLLHAARPGAKAIFFIVSRNVAANPAEVRLRSGFSSGRRRAQLVHAPRRPASLKKAQRAVHLPGPVPRFADGQACSGCASVDKHWMGA